MRKWLNKLCGLRTRQGQTTAEYAIIVALVAVSSIAVILIFGDRIRALFATESERLGDADSTATQEDFGAESADEEDVHGGMLGDN